MAEGDAGTGTVTSVLLGLSVSAHSDLGRHSIVGSRHLVAIPQVRAADTDGQQHEEADERPENDALPPPTRSTLDFIQGVRLFPQRATPPGIAIIDSATFSNSVLFMRYDRVFETQ